jgi:hypothetical protein
MAAAVPKSMRAPVPAGILPAPQRLAGHDSTLVFGKNDRYA